MKNPTDVFKELSDLYNFAQRIGEYRFEDGRQVKENWKSAKDYLQNDKAEPGERPKPGRLHD